MKQIAPVGSRIRQLRQVALVSQRFLSRIAGTAPALVGFIERCPEADPRGSTLGRLATALGVSIDYLVRGDGGTPSRQTVRDAVLRAAEGRGISHELPYAAADQKVASVSLAS